MYGKLCPLKYRFLFFPQLFTLFCFVFYLIFRLRRFLFFGTWLPMRFSIIGLILLIIIFRLIFYWLFSLHLFGAQFPFLYIYIKCYIKSNGLCSWFIRIFLIDLWCYLLGHVIKDFYFLLLEFLSFRGNGLLLFVGLFLVIRPLCALLTSSILIIVLMLYIKFIILACLIIIYFNLHILERKLF